MWNCVLYFCTIHLLLLLVINVDYIRVVYLNYFIVLLLIVIS